MLLSKMKDQIMLVVQLLMFKIKYNTFLSIKLIKMSQCPNNYLENCYDDYINKKLNNLNPNIFRTN